MAKNPDVNATSVIPCHLSASAHCESWLSKRVPTLPNSRAVRLDDIWVRTCTGKTVRPFNPDPDSICIEDIARALSNQALYLGHTIDFYSVAQHCVIVSRCCSGDGELAGLLHHAASAYLTFVVSGLDKVPFMLPLRQANHQLQAVIAAKFGCAYPWPDSVMKANRIAMASECRDIIPYPPHHWKFKEGGAGELLPTTICPVSPAAAERMFATRFFQLTRDRPAPGAMSYPTP